VNLSGKQHSDPDLSGIVERALDRSSIDPATLCLEVTERVVMRDIESALATLESLKTLGVTLSIDDFGSAHSSLISLKRLPLDIVKIDRSFIRGVGKDSEDDAIVGAVINLAHELGLKTIAEGVETADQLHRLRDAGCDVGQGYYFGRPRPAEAINELLGG
jgi:EAL domain-containing protein (putative c-di-GMP-specific phosphodiesterase class I)